MVKYKKIMAPFIVLAMVAVIWLKTGIYFETNDDKCITEILCGQMTGAPQARTVYVSYLLTLPEKAVPDYGRGSLVWVGLGFASSDCLHGCAGECLQPLQENMGYGGRHGISGGGNADGFVHFGMY